MPASFLRYFADRLPFGNSLRGISEKKLTALMRQSNAPEWHEYAILSRKWRRHACTACRWLNEVLPRSASIFEPGCGSGANLLWLGQQGFRKLSGSDIEGRALELGQNLAGLLSIPLEVWEDDGLKPMRMPQNMDAVLSVNWLYHIPNASFGDFLGFYRHSLKAGGYLACDMVTRHYDAIPGNQWHTKDINLPLEQRRPSEYTIRLDPEEVRSIAVRHGFACLRSTCFVLGKPQRAVYLLRRVE